MSIIYDAEVDILRLIFSSSPVEESDEDKPGIILDYDGSGYASNDWALTR